jgi:hypothetical protein
MLNAIRLAVLNNEANSRAEADDAFRHLEAYEREKILKEESSGSAEPSKVQT